MIEMDLKIFEQDINVFNNGFIHSTKLTECLLRAMALFEALEIQQLKKWTKFSSIMFKFCLVQTINIINK